MLNIYNLTDILRNGTRLRPWHIPLSGTVPAASAGGSVTVAADVGNVGDFVCLGISCSFSTLYLDGAVIKDCGACALSMQIKDDKGNAFMSDFVPLELMASPGRQRWYGFTTPIGSTDVQPSADFMGLYPLEYPFKANSRIVIEVRNVANTANYFRLAFAGGLVAKTGLLLRQPGKAR